MQCTHCKSPFSHSSEDMEQYKKFGFDPVNLCFECNQKERLCFRNERKLYNRKCDGTGTEIISIYSSDKPYKIYKNDYWHSDQWDGLDYGKDMDFNRPFFEKLQELQLKVPRLAILNVSCENSEYCNMVVGNKNCYLIFGGDHNKDALYGTMCMHNKNSLDLDHSHKNEWCYFMGDTIGNYGCRFTFDSKNCKNCAFLSDCSNCTECILCTNLNNKSYCIQNKQYSKEEYLEKKNQIMNGSYDMQRQLFKLFVGLLKKRVVKYAHIINCQNCTGDYLKESKNCHNVFDGSDCEDVHNGIFAYGTKDAFNMSYTGHGSEWCYSQVAVINSRNVFFSYFIADSSDIYYSDLMINCQDCFGCVGLRHKKYCILNRQYSKQEYENLKAEIIKHMKKSGEWGKFLPKNLSCFGYNESTAHQFYPLTKEQALSQGFKWHDDVQKHYQQQTYVTPDNIQEVSDDILKEILSCPKCNKNYKILPQELAFYRSQQIPIPRYCSECRHDLRVNLRNPKKLWNRECEECKSAIKTTYSPKKTERVLCEKCYLNEIY